MSQYGRFISYTAVAEDLIGNDGVVVSPIGGHIHTVGATPLYVFGNATTGTTTVAIVGLTDHALLVGDNTGNMISMSAAGATGEGLMGTTGNYPVWTGSPSYSGTVTAGTGIIVTTGDESILAGNFYVGNKSNSTTSANIFIDKDRASGAIISGDDLGKIHFRGHDSVASYISGASIISTSSGTIGSTRVAGNLKFYTHPDSAAADPTLRMTIAPTGEITIATPDSGTALTITAGGLTVTAGGLTVTAGGAGITGTTNINTTGSAVTSIGTGGTGATNIGNATGNTSVTGTLTASADITATSGNLRAGNTAANTTASDIAFYKSHGVATIITTGDALGQLKFCGYDGATYEVGAQITSTSSGTIGTTRIPADLKFYTHPDSSAASPTLRMTINSAGNFTMAKADTGTTLTITDGGFTVTAGTTTLTPLAAATAGLVRSSTVGALSALADSTTAGQVLISSATVAPAWASLASSGSTIVYTPGSNTLNLEVATATTSQRGGVILATNAETRTGTDTGKAVTPDDLSYKLGTQTVHGLAIGGGAGTSLGWMAAGTANQFVISGGASADPSWSTYTMPTTPVQGDMLYASSATVISQLAKDTNATRYLSNTGTNNNPAWSQVVLTTGVSGTLPIANGGTNSTSYNNNGVVYFNGTSLINDTTTTVSSGTLQTTTFRTGASTAYLSATGDTISAAGSLSDVDITLNTKGVGDINLTTASTAYNNGQIIFRGIPTGGWSESEWRTGQCVVQTTDATPTPILSIVLTPPTAKGLMVSIKILINGFQSDYSDCVGGEILATAYRKSPSDNIQLVGAPIINVNYTDTVDTSDIDASINTGTQSLNLSVIGVAAQNWNWVATYTYMYTISNL